MKTIIPFTILLLVNTNNLAFSASENTPASSSEGAFFFLGLIGLIVVISGVVMRCPSCGKWWARVSKGKREIDRKGSYKTVTRRDTQYNKNGEAVGHIERQEQVHITTVYYENYYNCKYCRHQWTSVSSKEYEG